MLPPGSEPGLPRFGFRAERGEVSTLLILFTTVMLFFFGAVHAGMVFHARSVVSAAAQDGLRAVQAEGGTEDDGRAAAEATLALAPGLLDPSVTVTGGDGENRVRVTARVDSPFGGFLTDVSAEVSGPKERFYGEGERK
jgi:TadE-like protein